MIIKAAVDAIRSVSLRFHEANKKTNGAHPHILLQVNDSDALFTIQLSGCPQSPASGRTLDEAFESLCANQDAEFLRRRAKTLFNKGEELMVEAYKLDGLVPRLAHIAAETAGTEGTAETAEAVTPHLTDIGLQIACVAAHGFSGTAIELLRKINEHYPDFKSSRMEIAREIEANMTILARDFGLTTMNNEKGTVYTFSLKAATEGGAE